MRYNVIDFLPYSASAVIKSKETNYILNLIKFIVKSSDNAINDFFKKEYENFDAHVSESLCQIRAWQIGKIADERNYNLSELRKSLIDLGNIFVKCENILNIEVKKVIHHSKSHTKTVIEYLKKNGLNIEIPEIVFYLTQNYILSKCKIVGEYHIARGINYNFLCEQIQVDSKTYARKVIHKLQRNISEYCCNYIINYLKKSNTDIRYQHVMMSLYFRDEIGRSVLPIYEVTKLFLFDILNNNKFIKISVTLIYSEIKKTFEFYMKPDIYRNEYELIPEISSNITGAITFIGVCHCKNEKLETKEKYIERFVKAKFMNIILSNMAQHPQYPGISLEDNKYNPYRLLKLDGSDAEHFDDFISHLEKHFLEHKKLATTIGCRDVDRSLFLLTHIMYDRIIQCTEKEENLNESMEKNY